MDWYDESLEEEYEDKAECDKQVCSETQFASAFLANEYEDEMSYIETIEDSDDELEKIPDECYICMNNGDATCDECKSNVNVAMCKKCNCRCLCEICLDKAKTKKNANHWCGCESKFFVSL